MTVQLDLKAVSQDGRLPIAAEFLMALFFATTSGAGATDLDSTVRQEMKATHIPGAQAAVISRGKLVYSKAFGMSNVEARTAMRSDTEMLIASDTKMFTAFALELLSERGAIGLDAPISKYDAQLPTKLGRITLRQLLSHTAGIKDGAEDFGLHDDAALGDAIHTWTDDYVFTEPGDIFSYSNLGFDLAGHILERAYGKPFATALAELIFGPAKMAHTTARLTIAVTFPFSVGYSGVPIANTAVRPFPDNAAERPSGGVFSNIRDLARFLLIVMNDGRIDGMAIFPAHAVQRFITPPIAVRPAMRTSSQPSQYADGMNFVFQGGHQFLQHSGSIAGFGSLIRFEPDSKFAVVVLTNATSGLLLKTFYEATHSELHVAEFKPRIGKPSAISTTEMAGYVGRYVNDPKYLALDIRGHDGNLFLRQVGHSEETAILRTGPDSFVSDNEPFTIVRDQKGHIKYLVIEGHALRKTLP